MTLWFALLQNELQRHAFFLALESGMNTNHSFSWLNLQLDLCRLAKLLYWSGWSVKRILTNSG